MVVRRVIGTVLSLALLGCAGGETLDENPNTEVSVGESEELIETNAEASSVPNMNEWEETPVSELEPIDSCRISDITGVRGEVPTADDQYYGSLGFPRSTLLPDTLGAVRILVVPFGYLDRPISEGRSEQLERTMRSVNLYVEAFSYGKASIEARVLPEADGVEVGLLEEDLSGRGIQFNQIDLATTIVEEISPEHLNTDFDVLLLLGPTDSTVDTAQAMDPKLTTGDGRPIEMPDGVDRLAILSGRNAGYTTVIVHELMHSWLGLEDLYPFTGGDSYTDRWSLMSQAVLHRGAELLGYERFLAGWLDDESVRCAPNDATTSHILLPVTDQENPGLVLIPESEHSLIAIETRGKTVFNTEVATPIFRVDTSKPSGFGPIRLIGYLEAAGDVVAAGPVDVQLVEGSPGQPMLVTTTPATSGEASSDTSGTGDRTASATVQETCSRVGEEDVSALGPATCRPTANGKRWILDANEAEPSSFEPVADVMPCRLQQPAGIREPTLGTTFSAQFSVALQGEIEVALVPVSFPSYPFDHDMEQLGADWARVGDWMLDQSGETVSLITSTVSSEVVSELDPEDIAADYSQANEVLTAARAMAREAAELAGDADVIVLVLPRAFTSLNGQGPAAWWSTYSEVDGTPFMMPGHVLTYVEERQPELWPALAALFLEAVGLDVRIAGSNTLETAVASDFNIVAGWAQWLLGWMNDDDVACIVLDDEPVNLSLAPLQTQGSGPRMGVVPISETEVLVVESHRDTGWSEGLSRETEDFGAYGLRVYVIDSARRADLNWNPEGGADFGSRMLISDELAAAAREPIGPNPFSPLVLQGESVRYRDVVVEYVEAGSRDVISISR